jgi:hypothetical protein
MMKLHKTLPAPERPHHLDEKAQWLAGEGAGSWFEIAEAEQDHFKITRYAPDGTSECTGLFTTKISLDLKGAFEVTYPSHCSKVTVLQNKTKIELRLVEP